MDETQFTTNPNGKPVNIESHIGGITIRAWLAIMLVGTVCLTESAKIYLAIAMAQPDLLKIGEPVYSMSIAALAYYFGQQKMQGQTMQLPKL